MLSDGSCFTVTSNSGHQIVWSESGKSHALQNFHEHDYYCQGEILCAGVMQEDRTPLRNFQWGYVIITAIFQIGFSWSRSFSLKRRTWSRKTSEVRPILSTYGQECRTAELWNALQSEIIECMECPAYSLDLNPTEHAWYTLMIRACQKTHLPQTG